MSPSLENFDDRGRNAIQMEFARELYKDLDFSEDEMLIRWEREGYAKRFGDYFSEHPEMEEKIFFEEDKDEFEKALEKLKKEILQH